MIGIRTIADLERQENIQPAHFSEAFTTEMNYPVDFKLQGSQCHYDRSPWFRESHAGQTPTGYFNLIQHSFEV